MKAESERFGDVREYLMRVIKIKGFSCRRVD